MLNYITLIGIFFFVYNSVTCQTKISKCLFYDKRNPQLNQVFYIPENDVNMYEATIKKLLSREISSLDEPIESSVGDINKKNVANLEDIKEKEENEKSNQLEKELKYINTYRSHAKNVLKNVEFKCENYDDYQGKIKCNLCIYTEIVNNKHVRQGHIVQVFMNECIYGFYYFDNINQYAENYDSFKNLDEQNTEKKIDYIYYNITKDVSEGNTNKINFFRQESSKYHPVCYVTE